MYLCQVYRSRPHPFAAHNSSFFIHKIPRFQSKFIVFAHPKLLLCPQHLFVYSFWYTRWLPYQCLLLGLVYLLRKILVFIWIPIFHVIMGLNYVLMFPGAGSNAGGLGQVSEFALKMMNSAIKWWMCIVSAEFCISNDEGLGQRDAFHDGCRATGRFSRILISYP